MEHKKLQKHIESLTSAHTTVQLRDDEKRTMKRALFDGGVETVVRHRTQFSFVWYMRSAAVACGVFALIFTPISFAAEGSLPGDRLYVIKTQINEEVRGALVAREHKDMYLQSLLERRNQELESLLQDEDRITDQSVEVFTKTLEENVTRALASKRVARKDRAVLLDEHRGIALSLDKSAELLARIDERLGARTVDVVLGDDADNAIEYDASVIEGEIGEHDARVTNAAHDEIALAQASTDDTDTVPNDEVRANDDKSAEAVDHDDAAEKTVRVVVQATTTAAKKDVRPSRRAEQVQQHIMRLKALVEDEAKLYEPISVEEHILGE